VLPSSLVFIFVNPWIVLTWFFEPKRFADREWLVALCFLLIFFLYVPGVVLAAAVYIAGLFVRLFTAWWAKRKAKAPTP
jgi:predicted branched-subunit amino acid permease